MCYAEGTAHDGVVLEPVSSPLLQATGRSGLHDPAHVGGQLADTAADFTGANADDHALGIAGGGMAGMVDLGVVGTDMGSLLGTFARHG